MISLVKGLDHNLYDPVVFVHADTDRKSMERVREANVWISIRYIV